MIKKVWKIYLNATRSIYISDDNKVNYRELIIVYVIITALSVFIVCYKHDKFIEDSKILAMLLSLFSGLMYSVLLKIPDKLTKLETIHPKENETIKDLKERTETNTLNNRTFNYLKNFSFTLSYSIIVAIMCIFFVIASSFFTCLLNFHLSTVKLNFEAIDYWLTFRVTLIILYRFLFVFFMFQFLYFITKSVIYLTDFTLYEFNNLK
ncbi:hypothetical protein EOD40_17445 [Flavobacterium sufflavum]|uniref:Uncharacterized protein n=1 Tax=Flavobacterium sufflavum TaxID=1921138 RepID=A0A437KKJ0_9FLAO|nr:hypothetical protein [Flavobacterium sufflavum]RVT71195.1 hypothetical protein EOD40_17445 [Flavobacterium sufflavum]